MRCTNCFWEPMIENKEDPNIFDCPNCGKKRKKPPRTCDICGEPCWNKECSFCNKREKYRNLSILESRARKRERLRAEGRL